MRINPRCCKCDVTSYCLKVCTADRVRLYYGHQSSLWMTIAVQWIFKSSRFMEIAAKSSQSLSLAARKQPIFFESGHNCGQLFSTVHSRHGLSFPVQDIQFKQQVYIILCCGIALSGQLHDYLFGNGIMDLKMLYNRE